MAGFDAVLDTCVVVDYYSIGNLEGACAAYAGLSHAEIASKADVEARRQRSRDTLLLAWYLHTRRFTTYSPLDEGLRILKRLTPQRGDEYTNAFTFIIMPKLQQWLFTNWQMKSVRGADANLHGNECDQHLVEVCANLSVPLITFEKSRGGI